MPDDRKKEWAGKMNDAYKSSIVGDARGAAFAVPRFTSGIISLDCASGGGWPFGRINILAGNESTGKTLKCLKAFSQIEMYDHATKKPQDLVSPDTFEPCSGLFVDAEGAFDLVWATKNGFNSEKHMISRPENSEQAIDIITSAIEENIFDLIVIDSIACLVPMKEIEDSAENWQIGLAARLNNKAFRKWQSQLNKTSQTGQIGPALICLNQIRSKVGVVMGDPRVLPGGTGQNFAASTVIMTKSGTYEDTKDSEKSYVELGGTFKKNKTYPPKEEFKYRLYLRDAEDYKVGDINNVEMLMAFGKTTGLIKIEKGSVRFGTNEFPTQKELKETLKASPKLYRSLWRSVVKAKTGYLDRK